MSLVGQFELIHHNYAIGWALDTEQPNQRLRVELILGGDVIATSVAEHLHKTLAANNVGDGRYGFAIPLPVLPLGKFTKLKVRIAGSNVWLKGEHDVVKGLSGVKFQGVVDGVSSGVIFGWVAGDDPTKKPCIEIFVGSTSLGLATIGPTRGDIIGQGIAAAANSFTFDLEPHIKGDCLQQPIAVINALTGQALAGSPVVLAPDLAYGHVEPLTGIELRGWATIAAPHSIEEHAIVELWVDGQKAIDCCADQPRADFTSFGISRGRCGFTAAIPSRFLDGRSHSLCVRHQASGQVLNGGEQHLIATLRYAITRANSREITGWLFIEQAPTMNFVLDAWEAGRLIASSSVGEIDFSIPNDLRQQFGLIGTGFRLVLPPSARPAEPRQIRITLAGQRESLIGKDILIAPISHLIHQTQLAAQNDASFRWWARDWIAQLRQSETADGTLFMEVPSASTDADCHVIDIIVPCYKGRDETMTCLRSVLTTLGDTPYQIIVINDASPEPALVADLRELAKTEPRILLLENDKNLGFVATVNRGMTLHPTRDVLLLNSDTLVPSSDWLGRIRSAAYAASTIATVTPFSNRATICSLPKANVDNDLPDGLTVTDLDTLCAQVNAGIQIDIPTAVGFCMFIKRVAINEVGIFDSERWGRGYGEENDFCLKAASVGWRNVAACDVFVQHHGAVSFGGEKQHRIQENLNRLNAFYPDYSTTINRFVRADPLSAPRGRIVLELMRRHMHQQRIKRQVLHITHAWGGGVQHHVDQLCAKSGLILRPTTDGCVEIVQPSSRFSLSIPLDAISELPSPTNSASAFLGYLKALKINAIHIHQWIGLPVEIWQLPVALGVPFDYTVHDYYSFCPRINLLDHTGRYCGQAPLSHCEVCLRATPLELEVDRAYFAVGRSPTAWRAFHQSQLAEARHVHAPCKDTAQRIQRALAIDSVTVKPHEALLRATSLNPLPRPHTEIRVAVIGAIGPNKGYDLLLALAQLAEVEAPEFRFIIVGYTQNDVPFGMLKNVQITGKYKQRDLQSRLAALDCHGALFLSPWPETYSYTLSEALAAGLTPIVPPIGALGERVALSKVGCVLPENPTPGQIISVLQTLFASARQGRN